MSKPHKKRQSIELRKAGKSINRISGELKVSKSTVARWTKTVTLTQEQRNKLISNSGKGWQTNSNIRLKQRQLYQNIGRQMARKNSSCLFIAGCMLYWAEGAKDRNSIKICNTDSVLLNMFVCFLEECLNVNRSKILVRCTIHDDARPTAEVIQYWSDQLSIPIENFSPPSVITSKKSRKQNRHEYGMCSLTVHGTSLVQSIFGAIKEIAGIDGDRWL